MSKYSEYIKSRKEKDLEFFFGEVKKRAINTLNTIQLLMKITLLSSPTTLKQLKATW